MLIINGFGSASQGQLEVSNLMDLATVCPMLRTEIVTFSSTLGKTYFRNVDVSLGDVDAVFPASHLPWGGMLPLHREHTASSEAGCVLPRIPLERDLVSFPWS